MRNVKYVLYNLSYYISLVIIEIQKKVYSHEANPSSTGIIPHSQQLFSLRLLFSLTTHYMKNVLNTI
jgi:hypothetical protein